MNHELENTLSQLHKNLNALDHVDANERTQLENSIQEMQTSLNRLDIKSSDLATRFHQSTQKYSEHHPQFTQTAGRFAAMLRQLGI